MSAATSAADEAPVPPPAVPPWLQAQTVRLVLSGLGSVYFLGILYDLRGNDAALAVQAVVLLLLGLVLVLTVVWWNPTGGRATKPHAQGFLGLALAALLVQVVAVAVEWSDPNDLANNAANLLILGILLLNTLG
ncbi:MAG: hypothetical protein L3K01_09165 [Thermoplasmata archaeon]|nr:hypothetical protein [Thermoplasmata archaeon]MCI4333867.1 hypothetical protein [Thermoplasmata archaeon]